jgi:hypothetical protein
MGNYWHKAPASRPIASQAQALTTTATVSAQFSAQTYQIRVVATQPAWFTVGNSSSIAATTGTSAAGWFIPGGVAGEYFIVNPGQWASHITTSATTGFLSITEMS